MRPCIYNIIRYIPDSARNEPVNIGIVAFCGPVSILRFDARAVSRAARLNRVISEDGLRLVLDALQDEMGIMDGHNIEDPVSVLASIFRGPFTVSEARFLGIQEVPDNAVFPVLSNHVDVLLDRLVKPVRRHTSAQTRSPKEELISRYRRFLHADQLTKDYEVGYTKTGLVRTVDAYLNHSVDTAIDFSDLRSDATRNSAIDFADAAKSKSQDLLASPDVKYYVVHLPTDVRPNLVEFIPLVRQVLKTESRVMVTTTADENEAQVRELVTAT